MRIKCLSRREGPAALDAVVTISTVRGQIEEVVVHRGYVNEGTLEVDTSANGTICSLLSFHGRLAPGDHASGFRNRL